MAGLAIIANRSFKQLVRLRIQTEQMAADLQNQKDIAERASLAKSTFLAAASHDLRQPVHALGLLAGALRGVPMDPAGYQLLDQIDSSINAMDGLFTALLDISRLDAGVVDVHRRPFAIAPLLERICRDHLDEASAKDVALILKPSEIFVDLDPVLLERIVRNLISNAVRYTDHGRSLSVADDEVQWCRYRCGTPAAEFPWTIKKRFSRNIISSATPNEIDRGVLGSGSPSCAV